MTEEKKLVSQIEIVQLSNYVRPEIKETPGRDYVLNGDRNSFYKYIIDRYNGSPTNRAIIDSYTKFIYGKGLTSSQQATKALQFASITKALSKKELRAICSDYSLFSEASVEVIIKDGSIRQMKHVPKNQIAPSKMDKEGDIPSYWWSQDFSKVQKYPPQEIDAFGWHNKKNGSFIYVFRDYQVGKSYYSDPTYLAGLPYAELEEEIANYCVNHIKNGLSFGHVINFNNGQPESEEVKNQLIRKYKEGLTGSGNAGKVVFSFNDNKEASTTVDSLSVSDAHEQYQFLSGEATQKIMISHCVTSPILFGIKDNTGLGNNAQEMESAFNELMINVIQPKKEVILDGLMEIFSSVGWTIDLDFIPLRQMVQPSTTLSKHKDDFEIDSLIASELIKLGEEIDMDQWDCVDDSPVEGEPTISEAELRLSAVALASVPDGNVRKESEQDTPLFLVRYEYKGSATPQREFCAKMMAAGKVYRKEDIDAAGSKSVNPGFGPHGANTYNIWLYKGGANCHHFWQRKIYLRKDQEVITASKFREILNALEPSERRKNDLERNDSRVAKLPVDMPNNGYLK